MKLTARQLEAQEVLAGTPTHILLAGGSRSGKTFLLTRNVCMRAIKAPKSRHAILRFRFNHIKASVILDTFPKVMETSFPGVPYKLNKTDWYAEFPNLAQIWFGGLDDKERTEKILGSEYATVYFNECSQIPQSSRDTAITRLAQKVDSVIDGVNRGPLKLRAYYDENPPSKAHWTYKMFVQKIDPETKKALPDPENYAFFQINPEDNRENVSASYLDTLKSLSARLQKRFLRGEFADATPNQLFPDENIDKWRVIDGATPDMVRVVVSVDPSGSGDEDNADNDEIGIAVVGLGTDGNGYLLEDLTVKAGPATWGRVAADAYERHKADCVLGEINFGGDMVRHVIQTARANTPFRKVTATRGKVVRAEPMSALYEKGKVRHVGYFRELEDELAGFSTTGFTGPRSPNRADALIWALTELFPALTKETRKQEPQRDHCEFAGEFGSGWMAS